MAETARRIAKEADLDLKVWDEKKLQKEGYNGLLQVGRGSSHPPRMIRLAYRSKKAKFHLALVGKGITFDTGGICIVTNEGNGRMVTTLPPVHIALMGMERLVRNLDDLAIMLSLLPRSATGQKLSVYTQIIHKPLDGQGRHIIILDNGRTKLRNSPLKESLYCIRCGSCLNACPVFREIGGHAYVGKSGVLSPYSGPIGSVISAGLFGSDFVPLAQASSGLGSLRSPAVAHSTQSRATILRPRGRLATKFTVSRWRTS